MFMDRVINKYGTNSRIKNQNLGANIGVFLLLQIKCMKLYCGSFLFFWNERPIWIFVIVLESKRCWNILPYAFTNSGRCITEVSICFIPSVRFPSTVENTNDSESLCKESGCIMRHKIESQTWIPTLIRKNQRKITLSKPTKHTY